MQGGYRYAYSLTHSRHDAEDLVHEAWLNLCRRYGAVGSRPVLFASIRNLFIDRCRRAKVLAFDPIDETENAHGTTPALPPGAVGDVDTLLGYLRPGEREAVYLHYIAGHTAEEIGTITRQPRGTVLSLLHRALKRLQLTVADSG